MSDVLLHLLRHGAPETPGLLLGRTDTTPTGEGIAACAAKVRDLDIEHLVASNLQRCRLAGAAIGDARNLPLAIDPRWRELDFGEWDGLAGSDIDSDALARFWTDPESFPPPQGESWSALTARVGAAIGALPRHPALVVTHGGAIRAALHILCGFDQRQLWSFDLPYGVLVSLRVWPGAMPGAQIVEICP